MKDAKNDFERDIERFKEMSESILKESARLQEQAKKHSEELELLRAKFKATMQQARENDGQGPGLRALI